MQKLILQIPDEIIPHRLYDLSIKDVEERKLKSKVYKSASEAMTFLGITRKLFYNNRTPGKKIFSPTQQKEFAVRIEPKTQK